MSLFKDVLSSGDETSRLSEDEDTAGQGDVMDTRTHTDISDGKRQDVLVCTRDASMDDFTEGFNTGLSRERHERTSEQKTKLPEDRDNERTSEQKTTLPADRDKSPNNPLALLKEDFNQFKEDLANVFKIRREDKSTVSQGDIIAKQDLANAFKIRREDISAVFLPIPSKEDLINAFRIKASSNAERDDSGITNAFRIKASSNAERDQSGGWSKRSLSREDREGFFRSSLRVSRSEVSENKGERSRDDKTSVPEETNEKTALKSKENWNKALRMNPPEGNEKTASKTLPPSKNEASETLPPSKNDARKTLPPSKNDARKTLPPSKNEASVSSVLKAGEMVTSSSEPEEARQTVWTDGGHTSTERLLEAPVCTGNGQEAELMEEDEEEEEDNLTALPVNTMLSTLLVGSDPLSATMSAQPGDNLWTLKQYACYVTLDPNTASTELGVSHDGRTAVRQWIDHAYPAHPERFQRCPQVLCREGLWRDRCYWEVEWKGGGVDIGVAYRSISRDGDVNGCLIGHNQHSWSVECRHDSYTPCHNNLRSTPSSPGPLSRRVGVHLDWNAGSLSFYRVSEDSMTLIHTFHQTFTQPLYPAFWLWGLDSSVTLCHIVLEWERLLL